MSKYSFEEKYEAVQRVLDGMSASYDGAFKVMVVEYLHSNHLSCSSTAAYFGIKCSSNVAKWEHIYYEEGPESLLKRKLRGRPRKCMKEKEPVPQKKELSEETKEDLIAELLFDYLKVFKFTSLGAAFGISRQTQNC